MDFNNLLITCLTVISVAACISISSCSIHTNNKIAEAIKNGADPVAARLAFENNQNDILRGVYIGKLKGEK